MNQILHYKDKIIRNDIYVVNKLEEPILSRDASKQLGIVQRLNLVGALPNVMGDPKTAHPKLFSGLGYTKILYKVKLRLDAEPWALMTPRIVVIPPLGKTKSQFEEMIKMGIIDPIQEPTEWCSKIVLLRKPNGEVRTCVHLIELNKFVERKVHPLPMGEPVLGQLDGARHFSKIDANSAFWHFEPVD